MRSRVQQVERAHEIAQTTEARTREWGSFEPSCHTKESEKPAERIPGAPDDDPDKEASLPAFGTMLDRPETVQSQLAEPVAGGPDSEPPARFGAPLLPILGSQASAATLDLDADDDEHLFSDDDAT